MSPWTAAVAALLCSVLLAAPAAPAAAEPSTCEHARTKCAYRTGCGRALQNYMMYCSTTLQQQQQQQAQGHGGAGHACPEHCQHALIALTSTDEGKDLMTCTCGDDYCEETKQRVEVCRPHVEKATHNDSIVSCHLAQWICKADALCSTAFDYYHRFCRSMFQGKRCSRRCINSISILRRQEKAAKLISCRCDGRDEAECATHRHNMDRLCFPGEGHNASHVPHAGHVGHGGGGHAVGVERTPADPADPAHRPPTTRPSAAPATYAGTLRLVHAAAALVALCATPALAPVT